MKKKPTVTRPQTAVKQNATAKREIAKEKFESVLSQKSYTFFENVYAVARLIPQGRVTSYGAIAHYLGSGKSARMVGYAMNAAHAQVPSVPAQRVVNRNGMLTGKHHFGTPDMMEKLLKKEGVNVVNDTVKDFEKLFWNPSLELGI